MKILVQIVKINKISLTIEEMQIFLKYLKELSVKKLKEKMCFMQF